MKSISFTMSQWSALMDLSDSELITMIRNIYRYATDNVEPKCHDGANRFFWNIFKDVIDSQRDIYDKRCSILHSKKGKSRKKSATSNKSTTKCTIMDGNAPDVTPSGNIVIPSESVIVPSESVIAPSESVIILKDGNGMENADISGYHENVDLSFEHIESLYPKLDRSDDYRATSQRLWAELDEDAKLSALSSIDKYISTTPNASDLVYLSQYLGKKVWLSF